MPSITPTVGRKVWYYEYANQREPIDATIIKVHAIPSSAAPDTAVNLDVVDPDTGAHRCEPWVSAGDEKSTQRHYRWMPYQIGQAARHADVGTVGEQQPQSSGG